MVEQLHKRFGDEQVKMILGRYIKKELSSEQARALLGLKRSQFFEWVNKYKESHENFTIAYNRNVKTRGISESLVENILKELKIEKALIKDSAMPIRFYNYSFISVISYQFCFHC